MMLCLSVCLEFIERVIESVRVKGWNLNQCSGGSDCMGRGESGAVNVEVDCSTRNEERQLGIKTGR